MSIEFITYLNLILIPRLAYLRNDGELGNVAALSVWGSQLALVGLVFQLNWTLLSVLLVVSLCIAAEKGFAKRIDLARGYRLLGLLILALIPLYIASFSSGFVFSRQILGLSAHLQAHLAPLAGLTACDFRFASTLVMGFLLLGNETNILVRAVVHRLDLEPRQAAATGGGDGGQEAAGQVDEDEYNAGRVIGILERWLMLLVILWSDSLSALGFIIAAKGLARMKQLEEKEFAEYMLVGTLLSALMALLLGKGIVSLAQCQS
jgi:hypothetical protein